MVPPVLKTRRQTIKALSCLATSLPFLSWSFKSFAADHTLPSSTTSLWLSGNTDLIKTPYPGDVIFESEPACTGKVTPRTTEGPCFLGVEEREDLSLGFTGLPMMLCLQVVDQDCQPIPNHLVEVWHCDINGVYSGDRGMSDESERFAARMCTRGDKEGLQSTWYRGEQTTNASGRVNFKSNFPGWYPGRTIHVHFRVRKEHHGRDLLVSQLCFDDDFANDICMSHPLYKHRGIQDTSLKRDGVFRSDFDYYLMRLKQNPDGSLLAYKRIMVQTG